MIIRTEDKDIAALIAHQYKGRYKKFRSNASFISNLDDVITLFQTANNISDLVNVRRLHYEKLKGSLRSSVRIGYTSKYRMEFTEQDDGICITIIEISEHYGDH